MVNKKILLILLLGIFMISLASAGTINVTLNSPADNETIYENPVTFSSDASTTVGSIVNMSLWTNQSGGWQQYNITINPGAEEIYDDFEDSTINGTKWTVATTGTGTVTETAGVLRMVVPEAGSTVGTTNVTSKIIPSLEDLDKILFVVTQHYSDAGDYVRLSFGGVLTSYKPSVGTWEFRKISGLWYLYKNDVQLEQIVNPANSQFNIFIQNNVPSNQPQVFLGIVNYTYSQPQWERNINSTTIWNVQACDSDGDCDFASSNYTLNTDTVAPVITAIYPEGTIEYVKYNDGLDLNWTISEIGVLDTCWYEYNNSNTTVTCNDNHTTFNATSQENLTFYANDSLGNLGVRNFNWSYNIFEENRIYNENTIQTAVEQFKLVLEKKSSITSISASFFYNGTEYIALKSSSGNDINFTSLINVPDIEGTVNFYWEITYTNSTGTYEINTTNSTQEIFSLSLQECFEPSVEGLTLNFTVYDSTNVTPINSSFEATFQFYSESGTGNIIIEYLFSDLNENTSNYMFCINSSGQNVTLDAFISYAATDYDRREYIINDGIIGNFTQTIPLYLALTELTDIVTITVQDQSYDPIAGALVAIQEWNVGTNTYSTIGMLTTSSAGQGIIDLRLYTTWYRAVVYVDGVITHVEDVQKLSSTSWIITTETGEENPYDLFGSIAHGLTFDNETNITSFTWLDVSGYTNRGCLIVQNSTNLGQVTIFNSCLSSVSGTIDYQIIGDGDFTAYGIIFLEGYDISQIVDELPIRLGTPEITEKVSPFGKVISFISIGTAGLIGVASGSIILGGALVIAILIVLMKFGFLNITWGFIWGMITIIIVAMLLQRRKK